jgi:hypothetical protein
MFSEKLKNKIKNELMEKYLSSFEIPEGAADLGFYEVSLKPRGEVSTTRVNLRHKAEKYTEALLKEAEELYCREYTEDEISSFCKKNNITKDVMGECWIKLKFFDEINEKNRRLRKKKDKEIKEDLETMDKEIEKFKKAIKRLKEPPWKFENNHSIFEDLYRVIEKLEQRKKDKMWLLYFLLGHVPKPKGRPPKDLILYREDIRWMRELKLSYKEMSEIIKFFTKEEHTPNALKERKRRYKNRH